MKIGYFPYRPGGNPYQSLFASALEYSGAQVQRIPPRKLFPIHYALSQDNDLLQMDWPHDWYNGRNHFTRLLKKYMYLRGIKALRHTPCVWTAHNLRAHDTTDAIYEQAMLQALISVCDGIIVMSSLAEDQLRDMYRVNPETTVAVIPHGHYIDAYPNTVTRQQARESLGLSDASRVILSLGRLMPYKGLGELIESFCTTAGSGDILLLAGTSADDAYLNSIRALAKAKCPAGAGIRLDPGFVADDCLQHYFNAADIVALPFNAILNSGSLLLAMSFGKCVVAPAIGSIPEVACSEGWFPYDPRQADGLTNAMYQALKTEDLQSRGRQVWSFTREKYNWETIGRKVNRLYSEILQREPDGDEECQT